MAIKLSEKQIQQMISDNTLSDKVKKQLSKEIELTEEPGEEKFTFLIDERLPMPSAKTIIITALLITIFFIL